MLKKYTEVFADSVWMMADASAWSWTRWLLVRAGACTKDVDLGWYQLPKGSLGSNYIKYQGMVDGVRESRPTWSGR